ncbi:MAG: peptidylprolyl isomerase [Tissierellaceae bacterium]
MIKILSRKRIKLGLILGAIILITLAVSGCTKSEEEIVAKVNDKVITKDDLYNVLVAQGGQETLESLINEIIINEEIEKAKIQIEDEQIEEEIDKMIESSGGEDAFYEAMYYYGYSIEDLKKSIDMNLKIKELLMPTIDISDDEIEEYFEYYKDDLSQKEEVRASHILVDEEEEANAIYDKLSNGESFEDLAAEHSKDGSAHYGGDLGYFGRGQMVKEFEEASFSLDIGEISTPVKSEFGYHIIMVTGKNEAKEADMNENKEKIKELILEEKIPYAYETWFAEIVEDYKIDNRLLNP